MDGAKGKKEASNPFVLPAITPTYICTYNVEGDGSTSEYLKSFTLTF
jgi:hypothetical protein